MNDLFQIGLGKKDITPAPRGERLLGWGDSNQRAWKVAAPLHSRAVVLKTETSGFLVIACLEICFITQALRDVVIERLQAGPHGHIFNEENVLLCATHTHCAPGGHSHDVLYNIPSFGWYPHVLEKYASGTVLSIEEAIQNLKPGRIRFAEGVFSADQPVAFNRSIAAWNQNPDVVQFERKDRHLAVDRTMNLFRFEDINGKFIGSLNEFAVHCTSVHRNYNVIHSDNKGIAAEEMERDLGGICLFVQGAAGDVSPNFQRFSKHAEVRGTNPNDLIAVVDNGKIQSDMACFLARSAAANATLPAILDSALDYGDMSKVSVDPQDVGGREGCQTGPAVVGAMSLLGTDEGMPTPRALVGLATILSRFAELTEFMWRRAQGEPAYLWSADPVQGPKISCLQPGTSEIFRTTRFEKFVVPAFLSGHVAQIKKWGKQKFLHKRPFTPQVLPLQAVRIGNWAWVAAPAEFTTSSGRRLKDSVLKEMSGSGVSRVLFVGYANAYASYVTTPEEYQLQLYEGASTHFGQWTQPGYQTLYRKLVRRLMIPKASRPAMGALRPPNASPEELIALTAPEMGPRH